MILKKLADVSVALTDLFHALKVRRNIAQQTHEIRKIRVLFGLVEDPVALCMIDCFPVFAILPDAPCRLFPTLRPKKNLLPFPH